MIGWEIAGVVLVWIIGVDMGAWWERRKARIRGPEGGRE